MMSQRCLRQKPRISYFEPEEPSLDEYVFCEKCADYVFEYCSLHGALLVVPDNKIYDRNNKPSHVVDAADGNKSNWMRYVNCARHWTEQNLVAFQYQGQLYYRTIRIIPRFSELMVFYGSEYANILQIDLGRYNSPKSYAQKFGAPAPKKPRFGVKIKKPLQALVPKPPEETKQCNIIALTNITTPSNGAPDISINTKNSEEAKPQTGPPTPKKRKTNKKSPPENVASQLKKKGKRAQVENAVKAKPSKETHKKVNNKKKTVKTKQKLCKDMQTADMKEKLDTKSLTNTTCEENVENPNTAIIKASDENTTSNKSDVKNENSLPGSSQINQSSINTQNMGLISIQDVYFCCNVCNHQSITKDSLVKHMRLHDVNKKFACDNCSYRFSTNFRLSKHKVQLHGFKTSSVKMHECNICEYTTVNQTNLNKHLLKHAGLKRYECDKCEYKCILLQNLKTHLRIHTGEKPYTCNVCNYKSTQLNSLKTHLRIHTGEKPHKCNVCDYKSAHLNTLKRHLRMHTGEKPYTCNVCNYKSARLSNLKIHLIKHTGDKLN